MQTIHIEEIPVEHIDEFWKIHIRYLLDEGIITDEEEIRYFQSDEYRNVLKQHMLRLIDKHHMIYFVRNGVRIGAAQYNTYQSEDGKCFILDYWVFPEFRGNGTGHQCFAALERYTQADGARYYELNCTRENAHRFWMSIGFVDCGVDEYRVALMIRNELSFRYLTDQDKRQICSWKYKGDYSIYDLPSYEEMKERQMAFLNPARQKNFLAFLDGDVLVGFVNIMEENTEVFIGIGVNPTLCGKQYGRRMLQKAYDISRNRYPNKPLYLEVRTWNTRAVRCYENAGFQIDGEPFEQATGIGAGTFYRMIRE